jgi:hypothetical protein
MSTILDARKYIDCRDISRGIACSLVLWGREEDVLAAAVAHAVSSHGRPDSRELRVALRQALKSEV